MLAAIAVAFDIRDPVTLSVQRAVKKCFDDLGAIFYIQRVFAANRHPVVDTAHVHIAGQVYGFVRKVMAWVADVDSVVNVTATGANKQVIIDLCGDKVFLVSFDAVIWCVDVHVAANQGSQTRKLGRGVEIKRVLRFIIPGDIHCAVPDGGGEVFRDDLVALVGFFKAVVVAIGFLGKVQEGVALVRQLAADRRHVLPRF